MRSQSALYPIARCTWRIMLQNIKTTLICISALCIQSPLLSQLPVCNDSLPSSLLRNNSFEFYSGCSESQSYLEGGFVDGPKNYGGTSLNDWNSFSANTWEVHYINYDCRSNVVGSIFDSTPFKTNEACSYLFPRVPQPLPDGKGFIAITENGTTAYNGEKSIVKNYLTQCLSQPLYAGQTYLLTFYFGFGTGGLGRCPQGYPFKSLTQFGVALYGRKDCPEYPVRDINTQGGCLTNNEGWMELGQVTLYGENEWVTGVIEFTPKENIMCVGIGPDCKNRGPRDFFETYYMDKLVLAPVTDFSFRTITAISGDACTGHYRLKAPTYAASTYQWYKDGVLIPAATSQTYDVPDNEAAAGIYVANIRLPYNTCVNTLPFAVKFSNLQQFSLGQDTVLCAPAKIDLNAYWQDAIDYLWQDGSKKEKLGVTESGTYWVRVIDNSNCTKRDSVNIIVQGCDKCKLFLPTAFTPNNDGLNDVFRVKPQCANIGLSRFALRIYDRWGELVFTGNDITKGWNGYYKGKVLPGVYMYTVAYSFKQEKMLQKGWVLVME